MLQADKDAFVCIRDAQKEPPVSLIECIAAPEIRFVDVNRLRDTLGVPTAYLRFRLVVLHGLMNGARRGAPDGI